MHRTTTYSLVAGATLAAWAVNARAAEPLPQLPPAPADSSSAAPAPTQAPPAPTTAPSGEPPSGEPPPIAIEPNTPPPPPPSASAPPPPPPPPTEQRMPQVARPKIRVWTWDLNIEGALGQVFDNENRGSWFVRGRTGVLHVHDDVFLTLGATYDIVKLYRIGGVDATNIGIQAEVMHLQYGVWLQLGGLVDFTGNGGVDVGAGWSLFGVEYQARNFDTLGPVQSFYGKIRIPVTIIYHAIYKHDL